MRYTGPNNRKARRLGFSILENQKEFSKGKKRTYAPGQHGNGRRGKNSEYKAQLTEKQKVALMYGLTTKQLSRFVKMANKMEGSNSLNLLLLLESRLDNIAYRMGYAPTRRASRQLVSHGFLLVNGKKVDIPSYICKIGDEISLSPKAKSFTYTGHESDRHIPEYVKVNNDTKIGKYVRFPEREELNQEINEAFVIEFFNQLS